MLNVQIKRYELFLEKEVYNPGEIINGRVECNFMQENKVRGIKVRFRGKAKVSWKEDQDTYNSDEEIYFEMESELLLRETTFPPGVYNYPFTFPLPNQLPSSMNEKCGSIKYTVYLTVDRPWGIDYHLKKIFTVCSYNNLSSMCELKIPSEFNQVKRPSFLFIESGPITINVFLPRSGFVQSQMIAFTAKVVNQSNINVQEVHFKLVQGFSFHVRADTKSVDSLVAQEFAIVDSFVAPKSEKSWDLELRVPSDMYNRSLQFCKFIKVIWQLRGEIILPFIYKNIEINVPFTLGVAPLT